MRSAAVPPRRPSRARRQEGVRTSDLHLSPFPRVEAGSVPPAGVCQHGLTVAHFVDRLTASLCPSVKDAEGATALRRWVPAPPAAACGARKAPKHLASREF